MLMAGKHGTYVSSTQLWAEDFILIEIALYANTICGMTE